MRSDSVAVGVCGRAGEVRHRRWSRTALAQAYLEFFAGRVTTF